MEHCNLRCVGCSHFAPLAPVSEYPIEEYRSDIHRLSELFNRVEKVELLGGEPLLNEKLSEYIEILFDVFPETSCTLVTNGILLSQMNSKTIATLKRYDIGIRISVYPIMQKHISKAVSFIAERGLKLEDVFFCREFYKPLNGTKREPIYSYNNVDYQRCICTNLYRGKISVCPEVMFINRFNDAFDSEYPEDGIINIHETELDGRGLVQELKKQIPLCDYCNIPRITYGSYHEWKLCGQKIEQSDFVEYEC